jgi:hypothetical protein
VQKQLAMLVQPKISISPLTLLIGLAGAVLSSAALAGDLDETGFVPLVVSNELTGWVEEQHDFFRAKHPGVTTWSVQDGLLHADGSHANAGFVRYDKKLCDFILRLEYRMSTKCNSGVGLRSPVPYTTLKPNTLPSTLGYEFQIMDDVGKPATDTSTGAFYGRLAPTANAARAAGEWNTLEIECRGPRIKATLNDTVVQDIDHTQVPVFADRQQCGYLSLQNHGHDIDFRNVRLKELNP